MHEASTGKGKKLNTRTFAIKDDKDNILVVVPVLLYRPRDEGYGDMLAHFSGMRTSEAVLLEEGWCEFSPMNSSTDPTKVDDD